MTLPQLQDSDTVPTAWFNEVRDRIQEFPGAHPQVGVVTKTAAATLGVQEEIVFCDASAAAFTVTLPTAVGITGRRYTIKKINSGANAVTIDGNSAETIDGQTTRVLSVENEAVTIISDGANWKVI